jgi:hypothetical protein
MKLIKLPDTNIHINPDHISGVEGHNESGNPDTRSILRCRIGGIDRRFFYRMEPEDLAALLNDVIAEAV